MKRTIGKENDKEGKKSEYLKRNLLTAFSVSKSRNKIAFRLFAWLGLSRLSPLMFCADRARKHTQANIAAVHTCKHTHTYIHKHTNTHANAQTNKLTYTYTCIHACMHAYKHARQSTSNENRWPHKWDRRTHMLNFRLGGIGRHHYQCSVLGIQRRLQTGVKSRK